MITLHPDISMVEAARIADQMDCYLHAQPNGDVVITPNRLRRRGKVLRLPTPAPTIGPDKPGAA